MERKAHEHGKCEAAPSSNPTCHVCKTPHNFSTQRELDQHLYKCLKCTCAVYGTSFSSMKALRDHWKAAPECGHAASSGSIADFMTKAKRVTTSMLTPSSKIKLTLRARGNLHPQLADFLLHLDCLELPEGFVDDSVPAWTSSTATHVMSTTPKASASTA
eukprot:TRINITY_DN12676_c2_g1_i4.p2 TRINITY_DN12676_c2_g1~~TRINITY_DN12676_c2_g1_i4.p2  ORF type:complete len:160 (+),score=37.30 TRINITY_DN12676_c2_g1_i4:196-675(+)